jgi:hypothetical protein
MFTDTFAGIASRSVPGFVAAQLLGLLATVALVVAVYPDAGRAADHIVVAHTPTPTRPPHHPGGSSTDE